MTKLGVKIMLVLTGIACAALVVCIISPEWFVITSDLVATTTTAPITTTTTHVSTKLSIIGQVLTYNALISGTNVTSTSVVVDYWRQQCSGACAVVSSVIPGCGDLQALGGTSQTDFTFASVCTMPKVVLSFVVLGMAGCVTTGCLIFWTVVANGPVIYAALSSFTSLVFATIAIFVYGLGVVDKANLTSLGLTSATSNSWAPGYGYGMCIASTAILFITTIVLFALRHSAFDSVTTPTTQMPMVMSPMVASMSNSPSKLSHSGFSSIGSLSPHRIPFTATATTATSVLATARQAPLNWQLQAQQSRSFAQQQQWKARV